MLKLSHILETCLYVDDLKAARRFYQDVLGLRFYSEVEGRHVFFKLENGMFLLFDPTSTRIADSDLPPHGTVGSGHAAFSVAAEELPAWRAQLAGAGVAIEVEHVWPNGAPSLYFRDPAGNVLELTTPSLWEY